MRDPNRIKDVLAALEEVWNKCPDLRFCQLIENFKAFTKKDDLFYMEDDEFIKALTDYSNSLITISNRRKYEFK